MERNAYLHEEIASFGFSVVAHAVGNNGEGEINEGSRGRGSVRSLDGILFGNLALEVPGEKHAEEQVRLHMIKAQETFACSLHNGRQGMYIFSFAHIHVYKRIYRTYSWPQVSRASPEPCKR